MSKLDPLAPTVRTLPPDGAIESGEIDSDDLPTVEEVPTAEDLPFLTTGDTAFGVELGSTISKGGMGVIRSARQTSLGREIAVKSVRSDADGETRQRILDEALIIGQLEHPHIVPIHEVGRDENGDPVILMKKIEGVSWANILKDPSKAPENPDKVDLDWHLDVLQKVCDAVRFSHSKRIIHCDIKPANVMIGAFGQVFLVDWGVAVYIGDKPEVRLPRIGDRGSVGTPGYAAPEMISGALSHDERTDVYMLGAVLHEVLTGKPRHEGKTVSETLDRAKESNPFDYRGVPEELGNIANKATARDQRERFQSVDEFWNAVEAFLDHRGSLEMAEAAKGRLEGLERAIRSDRSQALINDRFVEAQFGFKEALKQWSENEEARAGYRQALIAMIEYHLARGHADSAEALIPSLAPPVPRLEERLQELKRGKHEAEKALADFQHGRDLSINQRTRFAFAVAMTIVWTTSAWIVAWLHWGIAPEALESHYFASIARTCGLPALVLLVFYRLFRSNGANRRIVYGLLGILMTIAFGRLAAHFVGIPQYQTTTLEFFIYGLATIGIGLQSDIRIAYVGPVAFALGILSALMPEHQMVILGVLAFTGFGYLAWIWRPGATSAKSFADDPYTQALRQRVGEGETTRLMPREDRPAPSDASSYSDEETTAVKL